MTNVQHAKYRGRLPQLDGGLFLTDGGLETTLIFHEGFDLPMFAAFTADRERARPRGASRLLRSLCFHGAERRQRIHSGEPNLARQSRLGREARL